MTPAHHNPDASRAAADDHDHDHDAQGDDQSPRGHGRHATATTIIERAIEPAIEEMGYELLLLEWITSGKRRVLRVYLDHPDGVSVGDCSRMSRIISNTLDASDASIVNAGGADDADADEASKPDPSKLDPALAALLSQPYSLEVSSPGVDRPLTRRRHFAAQLGGRVKLETFEPLEPGHDQKKFHGRITAVEPDPAAPEHERRGVLVLQDIDHPRELRIPLPRIRRANLVWES
jgi:ribosome maturation factor RimP